MAAFNCTTWRSRAKSRYERALLKSKDDNDRHRLGVRYSSELISIQELSRLIDWCDNRKIKVEFGRHSDDYNEATRSIRISSRSNPEKQLCALLHECGHYLVDACSSDRKKRRRWSQGYANRKPGASRENRYRIEVVDEEFEAWDRGEMLASRLNLLIDKKHFHAFKARSLMTYFRWATKTM